MQCLDASRPDVLGSGLGVGLGIGFRLARV
jgi:hypothetical protein